MLRITLRKEIRIGEMMKKLVPRITQSLRTPSLKRHSVMVVRMAPSRQKRSEAGKGKMSARLPLNLLSIAAGDVARRNKIKIAGMSSNLLSRAPLARKSQRKNTRISQQRSADKSNSIAKSNPMAMMMPQLRILTNALTQLSTTSIVSNAAVSA